MDLHMSPSDYVQPALTPMHDRELDKRGKALRAAWMKHQLAAGCSSKQATRAEILPSFVVLKHSVSRRNKIVRNWEVPLTIRSGLAQVFKPPIIMYCNVSFIVSTHRPISSK